MEAFFIWFGLMCCAIANGMFFDVSQEVDLVKILMIFPCVGAIYLLYLHRRITKDWIKSSNDPWTEDRFPIFSLTLFFSVFTIIMLFILRESNPSVMVGAVTTGITSAIAFLREKEYTNELYGG